MGHIRLMLITALLLCHMSINAEDNVGEDEITRNSIAVEMALTSDDTWSVEVGYRFRLLHFLSAGVSLGYWKTYTEPNVPNGSNWYVSDEDRKISNFYLRPNIMFITPKLFSIRDCIFHLYANPGLMLNIPYAKADIDIIEPNGAVLYNDKATNHKGKWCAFDIGCGIMFGTDDVNFSIGYQFSTIDVYGMHRDLSYKGKSFADFYPKRKYQYGAVIGISYNF